jgi:hypothetical protein
MEQTGEILPKNYKHSFLSEYRLIDEEKIRYTLHCKCGEITTLLRPMSDFQPSDKKLSCKCGENNENPISVNENPIFEKQQVIIKEEKILFFINETFPRISKQNKIYFKEKKRVLIFNIKKQAVFFM